MAPIHADLFLQNHLMLNEIEVCIELHQNSDAFCIQDGQASNEKYKLEVHDMTFLIKKIKVQDNIGLAMESTLIKATHVVI